MQTLLKLSNCSDHGALLGSPSFTVVKRLVHKQGEH